MITAESTFVAFLFLVLVALPVSLLLYAHLWGRAERMKMTPEDRAVCDAFQERYWW